MEGGQWQTWCTQGALVYLWVALDGAATVERGMTANLEGGLPQMLIEFYGETSTDATGEAPQQIAYVMNTPKTVTLDWDLTDDGADAPAGSGHLWITAMYTDQTSVFEQVTVAGVAFDWSVP